MRCRWWCRCGVILVWFLVGLRQMADCMTKNHAFAERGREWCQDPKHLQYGLVIYLFISAFLLLLLALLYFSLAIRLNYKGSAKITSYLVEIPINLCDCIILKLLDVAQVGKNVLQCTWRTVFGSTYITCIIKIKSASN